MKRAVSNFITQRRARSDFAPPSRYREPAATLPRRFVHISAVERAGMSGLIEGQKVSFDVVADRRTGKSAAENLRTV